MRSLAGRYRVEEAVGRGGSAVVHSGWDRTLKRRVAIKLFSAYRPDSTAPSIDVLREAQTAAALNHPNVARVYDYGEATEGSQRVPYLVMEFLEGDTLADRLATTGALDWREAAAICADTAAALAAAHERNLVHRDVKPRNVMLTPGGVKVLDFGIAAVSGQNSFDTHGRLWGTPANLAPEQLRGEPTFPAADVYALALVLFECLTGARAWPGTSVGEVLAARHERRTPRLPHVAGLPREITRLYEACIADDPARRPTAAQVAEGLRRASGTAPAVRPAALLTRSVPALTRTVPAAQRTRSRRRAAVTASAAVAAAVISILGLQVANGYSTLRGRQAEAAVERAPGAGIPARTPQPMTTPRVTSAAPVLVAPLERDQPVRATTDTATGTQVRDDTRPHRPVRTTPPAPPTSAPATPTRPPTTPPHTPSNPPPTSSQPDPEPSQTPPHTTPPPESTETPPTPDPTDPPATTAPAEDVVLAEAS
ncbi:serine/threonine-protein kinase [Nucisporomicrobium flavum]|jgi:eukaryotic-like serine/threonine-protein kinase|uniref:serine/threonine-protein kinase n=1 Tax=Nucisporomicrobium flavum TaxID=2785915 RepID=UPI0018F532C8|nr:serine/threonine-protein kinase [Nucisporomicrobium flavum]